MSNSSAAGQSIRQPGLSSGVRLFLLFGNCIPFLHCLLVVSTLFYFSGGLLERVFAALASLYLLPPLLARILLVARPPVAVRVETNSVDFLTWWMSANLQGVFLRFPQLEEALRIVPGLYSLWLRGWGSRIGRLVYWAPGTVLLDRSYLRIGDDVIFGSGVRINPHVFRRRAEGDFELVLAPVTVESGAVVGGYSLLTAGSRIGAHEVTNAQLVLPPFSSFLNGKRSRPRE